MARPHVRGHRAGRGRWRARAVVDLVAMAERASAEWGRPCVRVDAQLLRVSICQSINQPISIGRDLRPRLAGAEPHGSCDELRQRMTPTDTAAASPAALL